MGTGAMDHKRNQAAICAICHYCGSSSRSWCNCRQRIDQGWTPVAPQQHTRFPPTHTPPPNVGDHLLDKFAQGLKSLIPPSSTTPPMDPPPPPPPSQGTKRRIGEDEKDANPAPAKSQKPSASRDAQFAQLLAKVATDPKLDPKIDGCYVAGNGIFTQFNTEDEDDQKRASDEIEALLGDSGVAYTAVETRRIVEHDYPDPEKVELEAKLGKAVMMEKYRLQLREGSPKTGYLAITFEPEKLTFYETAEEAMNAEFTTKRMIVSVPALWGSSTAPVSTAWKFPAQNEK